MSITTAGRESATRACEDVLTGTKRTLWGKGEAPDAEDGSAATSGPSVLHGEDVFVRRTACEDVAWRALTEFASDLSTEVNRLEQAIADSDYVALEEIAHSLEGAARNLSAVVLTRVAKDAESAREERQMGQRTRRLVEQLRAQLLVLADRASLVRACGAP